MHLTCAIAGEADIEEIVAVRNAAADRLTLEHGEGHWSGYCTAKAVLRGMATSRVLVARDAGRIIGALRLATKKPWAIDVSYFTKVGRAIYLVDLAVLPDAQGQGVGRRLCDEARAVTHDWPAQAIRLDAYDAPAGAAPFYERCGFAEVGRVVYRGVPLIYFEALI